MGANQSGVEHEILVLAIGGQNLEDPLPYAGLGPAREAGMDGLPLAVSFRQIVPVGTRAQNPQNAVDEQTVILAAAAGIAGFAWQQILDPRPLRVRQLISLDHRPCSESIDPEHKESSLRRDENPECRLILDDTASGDPCSPQGCPILTAVIIFL